MECILFIFRNFYKLVLLFSSSFSLFYIRSTEKKRNSHKRKFKMGKDKIKKKNKKEEKKEEQNEKIVKKSN